MKKKIWTLTAGLLLSASLLTGAENISIYSRYSPDKWGRADDRGAVTLVRPVDFSGTTVLPAPVPEGYLTAVLVDGRLVSAMLEAMPPDRALTDGRSTLSLISRAGRQAFRFARKDWGLDMVFSLEQAPSGMLDSITNFYRLDSLNKNLVLQEYRENRVVRIHEANDVLERDGTLSFGEALLAATLIGNTFQPFYGIHDGLGFLENLGYLLEKSTPEPAAAAPVVLSQRAPLESVSGTGMGNEMAEFLHRVETMPGSFPENLYVLAKTVCKLKEGEDVYTSPEAFLTRKWGGNREFALFFHRILKNKGYDVKLLRINAGKDLPNEYVVVYKEHSSREWGLMAAGYWVNERFGNWTRIPALYLSRSVLYQELDGDSVIRESRWIYPGSGKWEDSFY